MFNPATLDELVNARKAITEELGKAVIGQKQVINNFLTALFCGGHVIVEGVPGLAKTLLVSSLAKTLSLKFNRIQFTPDLMPSDITGTEILAENKADGKRYFQFLPGPVFANIILADEINRTPPKTQAALLQAMQEKAVTAGNNTYTLDEPFMVMATQNPIEQEGTYPLPEAQLDRFMFNIPIHYPDYEEELAIVQGTTGSELPVIKPVLSADKVVKMQQFVRSLPVSEHVLAYAVKLARSTRPGLPEAPDFINRWVTWGAGPRAAQYLVLGAKARAALDGRPAPAEDDVRAVAEIVLRHRVVLSFAAVAEGVKAADVVAKLTVKGS